ncbi:hypothetical protein MPH_06785 [Macrophomina phaseolina MS6]|uniref:Uncharacterized protein n=1 Tax=Macrophomina phaseolina (strain MS6) TaxID=1126212 RepID=K2S0F1_MACPH|nr:hypothetical protein MPH_06785 [Macrophomina phaseolina MS6]
MEWVFETDEGPSPMYGVETAVVTCWPDREEEGAGDEVVSRELLLVVNCTAWADSLEEASTLLRPWAEVPNELVKRLMARVPVKETTWEELFKAQDQLNPTGNGERWQCDSIFNDPRIQKKQASRDFILPASGRVFTDDHASLLRPSSRHFATFRPGSQSDAYTSQIMFQMRRTRPCVFHSSTTYLL